MSGKLYLIPNLLAEDTVTRVIPTDVQNITKSLRYFIVENMRNARRYLKKIDKSIDIAKLSFFELNKHTPVNKINSFLNPIKTENIGLISEAGCPAVADPGADIVAIAQAKGIKVVPLVGPSSLLLSLMASGLNGQNFAFVGYLPIHQKERKLRLKQLEDISRKQQQTQIFIETPYRNTKLLDDILSVCNRNTHLCIASNISSTQEYIKTKTIAQWKKQTLNIHKQPTIFLLLHKPYTVYN